MEAKRSGHPTTIRQLFDLYNEVMPNARSLDELAEKARVLGELIDQRYPPTPMLKVDLAEVATAYGLPVPEADISPTICTSYDLETGAVIGVAIIAEIGASGLVPRASAPHPNSDM